MIPWAIVRDGNEYAAPLEWIDPEEQPEIPETP
jgi:hypothetical protein